ncbi:uncharacterized protein LOC107273322 [Cephus cinctus]|uniref:Uncharacterized protein LOC107273322 n=1 Tax=Cephus cinctus TaxID=211228 RepID=A0AAJ7CCM0_CEPCN|nr:uncharacterized protein LOC107273322 [Cephus cinctus]
MMQHPIVFTLIRCSVVPIDPMDAIKNSLLKVFTLNGSSRCISSWGSFAHYRIKNSLGIFLFRWGMMCTKKHSVSMISIGQCYGNIYQQLPMNERTNPCKSRLAAHV